MALIVRAILSSILYTPVDNTQTCILHQVCDARMLAVAHLFKKSAWLLPLIFTLEKADLTRCLNSYPS